MLTRFTHIRYVLPLACLLVSASVWPQVPATGAEQDEQIYLELQSRLTLFLDEWQNMAADIQYGDANNLDNIQQSLQQLDAKWTVYSQAQQVDIATDEALLEIVGKIQTARQATLDQMAKRQADAKQLQDFKDAEVFIASQDTVYRRLSKTAAKMAMVKQMSPRLEKLKAREQLLFADIQARYEAAKAAAATNPALQERMDKVEARYVVLKSASEKIQAAKYQPLIARIKDYLLGFAAVAVILMFASMLSARLKAVKQARQAAKKMQQMMPGGNQQQYPTI